VTGHPGGFQTPPAAVEHGVLHGDALVEGLTDPGHFEGLLAETLCEPGFGKDLLQIFSSVPRNTVVFRSSTWVKSQFILRCVLHVSSRSNEIGSFGARGEIAGHARGGTFSYAPDSLPPKVVAGTVVFSVLDFSAMI
jgi:hypothetical protein